LITHGDREEAHDNKGFSRWVLAQGVAFDVVYELLLATLNARAKKRHLISDGIYTGLEWLINFSEYFLSEYFQRLKTAGEADARDRIKMTYSRTCTDLKKSVFYEYHHATKHTVEKLRSYGHRLDWNSQPNPFLHYDGVPLVDLPHEFSVSGDDFFTTAADSINRAQATSNADGTGSLVISRNETGSTAQFVSSLLFYSMAISAWKQVVGTDHKWALRVNASSGNLHPTDTHVLVKDDREGLEAGSYHYRVDEHKLEKRASGDLITPLMRRLGVQGEAPPLVLCLTSIFFREAWKYRDRAFRYCHHDAGHALAAITLSAEALGWSVRIIGLFPDDEVGQFIGLKDSSEKPMAFVLLAPASRNLFPGHSDLLSFFDESILDLEGNEGTLHAGSSLGKPNRLSSNIIDYPSIDRVYQSTKYDFDAFLAARRRQKEFANSPIEKCGPIQACAEPYQVDFDYTRDSAISLHESVHQTIRGRRSAVDMDGRTGMAREHLEIILRTSTLGFPADFQGVDQLEDGRWRKPSSAHLIHLYLYVHRVNGMPAGLYYFDRFENQLVPLLLSDQREIAKATSCFQDIACDGAFSVSMVADFVTGYRLYADRCYRLAHYEAGYIGQMMYLSAFALGHDATGIGCFVDDDINKYLALDSGKEVIYNFTFGKAVLDKRLTTLPSHDFSYPKF
jgi:SagB-type dehydrogenase family enzyme